MEVERCAAQTRCSSSALSCRMRASASGAGGRFGWRTRLARDQQQFRALGGFDAVGRGFANRDHRRDLPSCRRRSEMPRLIGRARRRAGEDWAAMSGGLVRRSRPGGGASKFRTAPRSPAADKPRTAGVTSSAGRSPRRRPRFHHLDEAGQHALNVPQRVRVGGEARLDSLIARKSS